MRPMPPLRSTLSVLAVAAVLGAAAAIADPPANVRVYDPTGDPSDAAQHSPYVAGAGAYVGIAFEDRYATSIPFPNPRVNFAWSADGGATFVELGAPHPPRGRPGEGAPGVVTFGDGTVGLCSQVNDNLPTRHSGVGFVSGVPGPLGVTWGTPAVARQEVQSFISLPCLDIAAGTAPGAVGMLYFDAFDAAPPEEIALRFSRSIDGGQNWSAEQIVWNGDAGDPHIERGANGEFWSFWSGGGNLLLGRRLPDDGADFEAPFLVAVVQFNETRPGNSPVVVPTFDAAIDVTTGPHRGRVYVAYPSGFDASNDPVPFPDDPDGTHVVEVEPNDTPAAGTPFVPGAVLRGVLTSGDVDVFTLDLDRAEPVIVIADSQSVSGGRVEFVDASGAPIANLRLGGLPGTFCPPATGTYGLRVVGSPGSYRLTTAPGSAAGSPALDDRDILLTWSDDGATWSPPVRVNRDAEGHDDDLVALAVGGDGYVYAAWHDFEAEPFAARSRFVLGRSRDGGVTWERSVTLSDSASTWVGIASNFFGMGFRSALAPAGWHLIASWPDSRRGNPDVMTAAIDLGLDAAAVSPVTTAAPGRLVHLEWQLENRNPQFENRYAGTLSFDRAWDAVPVVVSADPGGAPVLVTSVTIPDSAASGPVTATLDLAFDAGTAAVQAVATIDVDPDVLAADAPGSAAGIRTVMPSPMRGTAVVEFSLARSAETTVEVLDAAGALVRRLESGHRSAGTHRIAWDGRRASGESAPPGVYVVRLRAGAAQDHRRIALIR